ncbi:MAG: 16S rRNA (uracil(1498)-N(3))-methyltransferase [Desulfobacteraceae bacterium]|jgi:16S rRNA (uracil1498-N3)-methyltransferase
MRRFYIPANRMGKEETIITGNDAHHLRDVLRLQPDDRVVVFDGAGGEYQAQVVSVERKQIRVAMLEKLRTDTDSALQLTIAQGYLKDKKMDGLVRQLSEVGVSRWIPFSSRRSIPTPDPKRMMGRSRRWHKISLESLKQCGRSRAMSIDPVVSFGDAVKLAADYDLKIIFWEESKSKSMPIGIQPSHPASVFVMIGPEGGFEAHEISHAQESGFKTVGLGPRILRAETAALAAAVMMQHTLGDMGQV